ncbi:MAG: hypothetical protein IPK26_01785 [Planctomycetes bacterium]|nr:hypothetical protein [Planctomycetota bacterium]
MTRSSSWSLSLFVLALLAADLAAQRGGGGRRRPAEVLERVGTWFTVATLPAAEEGQDRLASVDTVAAAVQAKELSVLYVWDSTAEAQKREQFENTMFGSDEVGVALRCFRFARLDLKGDADLTAKYGKKLPVFVVFDEHGKQTAEVSFAGYKAAVNPLTDALGKAAAGHVKPTLAIFVSDYRECVREIEVLIGQRKALSDRVAKAEPAKRAALEKDLAELDAREKKLLATEKELLEKAKVPVRDAAAKRFEPRRGR